MPSGGRRRGAGAPLKTMSSIKTGEHSKQLREALFSADPDAWPNYLARIHDPAVRERVRLTAALILVRAHIHKMNRSPGRVRSHH